MIALVVHIALLAGLGVACFLIGWYGSFPLRQGVGGFLLGWALGLAMVEWLW